MATERINVNGNSGKDKHEIHFGHPKRVIEDREKMQAELDKRIFQPLGLLAGLLTTYHEEKETTLGVTEAINSIGFLLGLIVHGINKEVDFQVYGMDKDKLLEFMVNTLTEKEHSNTESGEGASCGM